MARHVLQGDFYARDPVIVARELLNKRLVRRSRAGLVCGRIVEVEAYLFQDDPACHAARGCTPKNAAMFGPAGHLYVYSIHARWCMNAVTESRGIGSAVLIRAVEPEAGIALMQSRRARQSLLDLARGPARLCQAFDVDRRLNGWNLTLGRTIWVEESDSPPGSVAAGNSVRIGVTSGHELPLRFFLPDNPYVSGPRRLNGKAGNSNRP